MVGSYGDSTFGSLRNLHTVFCSGCTNLHSHQQCRRVPLPPQPSPEFVICRLLNDVHSDCYRCHLIVTLICISLIISDVEQSCTILKMSPTS